MIFTGSCVALSTPLTEKGVNFDAFEKLINFQILNNTDALLVCGTTGEPSTMTTEEKHSAIEFCVKANSSRVPVIAGVGGNNTADVISSAKHAQNAGVNALLAVTPYYNKCTTNGLKAHFNAVADSVDIPVIIYNVPSRTGVNISSDVFNDLINHKNIVAIKEASGNISQIADMAAVSGERANIYSGNDDHVIPVLSLGGIGVISVMANIIPKYTHDMVCAYLEGNTVLARDMQLKVNPLVHALFSEVNPIPVKTALRLMGYDMGELRLPLCEMEEKNLKILKTEMKNFGLID